MLRRVQLVLVAVMLLSSVGCMDEERKPIPIVSIEILAESGAFMLNQQRVDEAALRVELRRIADENRRPLTNTSRAYVRIATQVGADEARKATIVDYCISIGLDKIEQSSGNSQ
jgi:hypothetical protein